MCMGGSTCTADQYDPHHVARDASATCGGAPSAAAEAAGGTPYGPCASAACSCGPNSARAACVVLAVPFAVTAAAADAASTRSTPKRHVLSAPCSLLGSHRKARRPVCWHVSSANQGRTHIAVHRRHVGTCSHCEFRRVPPVRANSHSQRFSRLTTAADTGEDCGHELHTQRIRAQRYMG